MVLVISSILKKKNFPNSICLFIIKVIQRVQEALPCIFFSTRDLSSQTRGGIIAPCSGCAVLTPGPTVKTQVNLVYIKPMYLNPQKWNTTAQYVISDQERWDGRGSVTEKRKIMLIKNQESHLHVVDLDSMSGLSASFCRWINRTRGSVDLTVWWLMGVSLMQLASRVQVTP